MLHGNGDHNSVDTSSGSSSSSAVPPGCACLPSRLQAAAGLAGGEVDGGLSRAARLAHKDGLQTECQPGADASLQVFRVIALLPCLCQWMACGGRRRDVQ